MPPWHKAKNPIFLTLGKIISDAKFFFCTKVNSFSSLYSEVTFSPVLKLDQNVIIIQFFLQQSSTLFTPAFSIFFSLSRKHLRYLEPRFLKLDVDFFFKWNQIDGTLCNWWKIPWKLGNYFVKKCDEHSIIQSSNINCLIFLDKKVWMLSTRYLLFVISENRPQVVFQHLKIERFVRHLRWFRVRRIHQSQFQCVIHGTLK